MKKILLISDCYSPVKGGAVTSAVRIVKGLAQQSVSITVLTPMVEGTASIENHGSNIRIMRCPSFSFPTSTREFLLNGFHTIEEHLHEFDLIMSFQASSPAFLGSICAASAKLPHIILCRGSDVNRKPDEDPVLLQLVKNTLQQAAKTCVVSDEMKDKVLSYGVERDRVITIVNSVNLEKFSPGTVLPEYDFLLVGPAREFKGFENVIHACAKVKGDFKLLAQIYPHGRDPKYYEKLQGMVIESGLTKKLIFEKPVGHDQMPDIYRSAKCTIISSFTEGCSNVLLESMASGREIMIRNIPSMMSVAGDLVDSFSTDDQLSELMQRFLDKKWKPRMDLISHVQDEYSFSAEIKKYIDLIEACA